MTVEEKAKLISEMILKTDTEIRGNLFEEIGMKLREESQGFTGSLFIEIANTYGIKKSNT